MTSRCDDTWLPTGYRERPGTGILFALAERFAKIR